MPKTKIEAVTNRIFNRMFICMKCNAKIRAEPRKVRAGKIKCRKCYSKDLRPKSKERKI
ncbi:MAG: 50S ribosomal protein L40e [Candidatus Aenigmatarchaeota archaeon]